MAKMNPTNSLLPLWILMIAASGGGAFAPRIQQRTTLLGLSSSTSLQMGILNRFRKRKEIKIEPIQVGKSLPEMDIEIIGGVVSGSNETSSTATIHEVVGGPGTNLLVGMPGAYTPTCSAAHMPGYIQSADKLKQLGVNTIAVVTTNDKFVNDAWAKDLGIVVEEDEKEVSTSPITVLADGDGDLVKELGLVEDMGYGIGVRSKRFAMILKDGVVSHLEVDEGMDSCDCTSAENMVKILTPEGTSLEETGDVDMSVVAGIGAVLVVVAAVAATTGGGGDAGTSDGAFTLLNQFS